MLTFIIGLMILVIGGYFYGAFCEKVFAPDNRETPAITHYDGVDYVPIKKWKSSLIQLLNIAGTGPILGAIQGILFGPIAFILIPIGCVFGGALHDYMVGMISVRNQGSQMPIVIKKYMGKTFFVFYNIFVCLLMLLVGAVFVYTPVDLFVGDLLGQQATTTNNLIWLAYIFVFIYYLLATLFPIDKLIGKIYPFFAFILLISSFILFFGIFIQDHTLINLSLFNWQGIHPDGIPIIPVFFVTISCGIVSGFHSTQSVLIGRTLKKEKDGRSVFFNTMIMEGFIAMVWAAAAMGIYTKGIEQSLMGSPLAIGVIARDLLGNWFGILAILGVIILPLTSGDTALRSLRLMLAEFFNINQKSRWNRVWLSVAIFIPVIILLIYSKLSTDGFNILWRYFAWSNQTIAIFAFALITMYLISEKGKLYYLMSLIPGTFYCFVVSSYILNAQIGFNLPMNISYIIAALFCLLYIYLTVRTGKNIFKRKKLMDDE
jgi:carbon starvation protein CstA